MKIEKKYLIYGLVVILLLVMSVSLAYFQSRIVGDKKDVVVNSKDLKVIYTGGTGLLSGSIDPGFSTSKTFTVKNESGSAYEYDIVIKDLVNTFVTSGFLQYKITSTDGGYNMTDYVDVPKSSTKTDTVLAYSVSINNNSTHTYTLSIVYTNSDTVDQSDDMGKKVSGSLYIKEGTANPTLTAAMLRDNPIVSERTDFSVTNTAITTGTLYKTNKTEDGSIQYYYSGNTTNNWVKFGGFYWRIIRTNEDGSVRLLYTGTSHDTTEGYINSSTAFNSDSIYEESRYVGYMYGGNTSLADNRTNTTDSEIKGVIDTWYQDNLLTNYDKYISKSAIYCNDRSIGSIWTNSRGSAFYYGAYTRLVTNKAPNYKCGANASDGLFESTQAIEDKFSASTSGGGNGQLTYPIALMTADEVAFAGGVRGKYFDDAWYYLDSAGESITGSYNWWLMSPSDWNGDSGSIVFLVLGSQDSGFLDETFVFETAAVRPAISISSCAKVTGTGTATDPYVIDTASSTC